VPEKLNNKFWFEPSALLGAVMENDQCTFQIIDLDSRRNPA
jgi:hypothetical protein